jgi:glycosyltransferase involved in cell wall biosynthesis
MHIGIDNITPGVGLTPAVGGGGIKVYLVNLMRSLLALDQHNHYTLFGGRHGYTLFESDAPNFARHHCRGVLDNRAARVAYEQVRYPRVLRQHGIDVLLATCNVMPLHAPCPTVVVVRSLQYFVFPLNFSRLRLLYLRTIVPRSLRKASAVIVVSESTRADVIRYMRIAPEKIHVVYHGLTERFRDAHLQRGDAAVATAGERYSGGAPYLVAISTLYRFKNYERLIRAFAQVKRETGLPHRLLIVGSDADVTRAELMRLAEHLGIGDAVCCPGGLPHHEVLPLYLGAEMMCYPSLYETFGHPLVEAMASGCPALIANCSSLPEIAAGAAEVVNPYQVESIAAGMRRLLTDPQRREELRQRGIARVRHFSWEQTARQTLDILQHACHNGTGG